MRHGRMAAAGVLFLFSNVLVHAEDRKIVLILKSPAAVGATPCEDKIELKSLVLWNPTFSGKKDVRLAPNVPAESEDYGVSRTDYDRSRSVQIADLSRLESRNGLLYAFSGTDAPILCIPSNVKPDKNRQIALRELYSVTVEGEVREGKSKQRQNVPLKNVWKGYLLNPTEAPDSALFHHATAENRIGLWKSYLKATSTFRVDEAVQALSDSLTGCAEAAIKRFQDGKFAALDEARKYAHDAQSVRNNERSHKLLAAIDQEGEQVSTAIAQAISLYNAEKWDEALTAAEGVKKYLAERADFAESYRVSLQRSHDLHVEEGGKALGALRFEVAVKEYEIALARQPNSADAKKGRSEAMVRAALRDSQALRKQNRPAEARQVVLKTMREDVLRSEARLSAELNTANCEYGKQLFTEAQALVTVPRTPNLKAIGTNPSDRTGFMSARAKLMQSAELCSDNAVADLLNGVNERLGNYYIAQAKSAITRKTPGTAYLYLPAAYSFVPERPEVQSLMNAVRPQFDRKRTMQVGIVFRDMTPQRSGRAVAQDITDTVRSGVLRSASNIVLIEGQELERIAAQMKAGGSDVPVAIFAGDLTTVEVRRTSKPRQVAAQRQVVNPQWQNLKNRRDSLDQQYDNCRSNGTEQQCAGIKSQRDSAGSQLKNVQTYLYRNYQYTERDIAVTGAVRSTVRLDDSITRVSRQLGSFEETLSPACVERTGVQPDEKAEDEGWGSILGGILNRRAVVENQACDLAENETYLGQMVESVKGKIEAAAAKTLGDVQMALFKRAQTTPNKDLAMEDYIVFVCLSKKLESNEVRQALAFIKAKDDYLKVEELVQEGVRTP